MAPMDYQCRHCVHTFWLSQLYEKQWGALRRTPLLKTHVTTLVGGATQEGRALRRCKHAWNANKTKRQQSGTSFCCNAKGWRSSRNGAS
uniref:Uncharacterized protein n=1 Tax=Physcomitrium patens TaxID=3218 RepID=A0A2K1J1E8_PHYPA|nr:hypothetical protein PHYPA_023245 [Physcomitrium patens]